MESREHRRTIGAQENTEFTIPDTVCVLGVLVLCGIHLSYSIAHQEQSGASWLKQTAMHFMDVIHEGAVIFSGTYCWEAFCRDTYGLSPGSFAVHQSFW